jgi:peptidoglycan/xylan/chitin deacetylase (PgdA/CDA1 family)
MPHSLAAMPPVRTFDYWEELFSEEDPWKYSVSAYESWKSGLTLGLLPTGKQLACALEVGCAEGHMTARLAQHVERLVAVDMSSTAIERAMLRCAGFDHVEFQQLDIVEGRLPKQLDLILVSEVLYYLSRDEVALIAKRFAEQLKVGGHVLLVHGNAIQDDRTRTGFDWGHDFGALTIGQLFAATKGLSLSRELRSPLFTIQLFHRTGRTAKAAPEPERVEVPLPFDLELPPDLERAILWDGAVTTRGEAQATESTSSVPILMYHAIADAGPPELADYRTAVADFEDQLRYLRRHGYHSLSLTEWADAIAQKRPVPGRPVIITFDDGYEDFFSNALPALERNDFTATVFVVTDKAGALADWDRLEDPPRLMDWDQIREAVARNITIGSHSASHKHFLRIPAEQIRAEGERARRTLSEQLGHEVDLIAFPWGCSDAEGRRVLAECGYRIAVRSWGGLSTLSDDVLELSRIEINGTDDLETFIRKIHGEYQPPDAEESAVAESELVEFGEAEPEDEPAREGESEVAEVDLVEFAEAEPEYEPTPKEESVEAEAELVEFEAPARAPLRPPDFSLRKDYRLQLAARLDALMGEFVKMQVELLNDSRMPMTAQKRIARLFSVPVTGRVARSVRPNESISEGVHVSFEETANLNLLVEPKEDHSLSPESYLNTLRFELSGKSQWFTVYVALDWRELSLAKHFQLSLYAKLNRDVTFEAALRLPKLGNDAHEYMFSAMRLPAHSRQAAKSGEISLPDFINFDVHETPQLVFFFDTKDDLVLDINYLNCYFA